MPNLVGTGLNQVPTNGMLGGLAYQSPDHASIKDLDLKNLSQINSEIANTAVDIFIYDTSKDSDGGAWRQRTQHTSWYNETLNTATRGARREFPAVAVIVVEQYKVTIYDGDDPDLPMWMVFLSGGSYNWSGTTRDLTSIYMLNGILVCGYGGSGAGAREITFISDIIRVLYNTDYKPNGGIKTRNDSVSWGSGETRLIVNNIINDVAMTVLPTAPIDPATGLPVPTIAVATDGGVSVIKDDGTVVDSQQTQAYSVTFRGSDIFGYAGSGVYSYYTGYTADGFAPAKQYWSLSTTTPLITTNNSGDSVTPNAIGMNQSTGGLVLIDHNTTNFDDGMVAYATTSYNTGWQHGAIKGAFLSDTDATNVTGTELITNGTFDTDTIGWSGYGEGTYTTLSIDSGRLKVEQITGTSAFGFQTVTTEIGKTYVVTADFTGAGSAGRLLVGTSSINGDLYAEAYSSATRSVYATFTATTTTTYISAHSYASAGNYVLIDNVTCRIADPDRSVNDNGLQVFGTVTKSAVATGAELVSYSGWNSANYLFQPYNSDLDFTDTMMIMLWVKGWESSDDLLHRGPNQTRNSKTSFALYCDGGYDYRLMLSPNGSTEYDYEILLDTNQSGWQHLCFTLSGGTVRGFLNGEEKTLNQNSFSGTIFSQATDQNGLWIGRGPVSGYPVNAHIALLRLSASAPSAEQIKKMYEDEKVLFQENANATLYGSSDAVTALAYDEKINLLHVGTSSGRSDFNGLRRINNTTEAVTTAISAYDGSIAQQ